MNGTSSACRIPLDASTPSAANSYPSAHTILFALSSHQIYLATEPHLRDHAVMTARQKIGVASSSTSLASQLESIPDEHIEHILTQRIKKQRHRHEQRTIDARGREEEEEEEDEKEEDDIQEHQQPLLDTATPLASSPSIMLLEDAPREFSHRVFFGLIPQWILILTLVFFIMVAQEFANTLAENAQRIQEMEFFTDGFNCDNFDPVPQVCIDGLAHQSTVDNWNAGLTTILAFMIAPIIGVLSDLKGRRPLLIFGMAMNFLQHLMYTLRWIAPHAFTYYWVVASQIIVGSVNISVTDAIISDIVPARSRSMWLGLSLALVETADMILPQVSQYLRADIAFPSAMALVSVTVIGSCFMPETLIEKYASRITFSWSLLSPVRAFSMLLRYRIVTMLALAMFMIGFLVDACESLLNAPVGAVFPTSPNFQANMNTLEAGLSMFMLTVGQYTMLRFFSIRMVLVLSAGCLIVSIIGTATLTSINQIYGWAVPFCGIEILAPVLLQILSTHIGPEEFGTAIAAILALQNFGEAIAGQFVTPLYFWWSPAPGSIGPSAGGSMHFFPQLLFSMLGVILCVLLWNMHEPTQGEKEDYARVKKEEKKMKAQQEQQKVEVQHENRLMEGMTLDTGEQGLSINQMSTAIHIDQTPLLE